MQASGGAEGADAATVDARIISGLVRAAQAGDRTAFGTLYERYARFVHGVLLANADREEVPDLVQDVFLRALRQLPTLRDPCVFGGWLATLARNEARMHHRSEKPTEALSDAYPSSEPRGSDATLWLDDVLGALRALPERYREPLTLRLVEGMGGEDIAQALGLTHGTVRVYLHHGFTLLRERLGAANV